MAGAAVAIPRADVRSRGDEGGDAGREGHEGRLPRERRRPLQPRGRARRGAMGIPFFVGRDKSISALNEVMKKDKKIILVTQKNSEIDDPKKTDIFMYGCEGSILQLLKLPDGTVKVLVEGIKRVKILPS